MKKTLLMLLATLSLDISFAIPPVYIKGGSNYFWQESNAYSLKRINPLEGSFVPSIASTSLDAQTWAGNIGLGITYPIQLAWKLSPELSYTGVGRSSNRVEPFLFNPDQAFINHFDSTIAINVLTAGLNIERSINETYSIYITPAVGAAFLKTSNRLNYQTSPEDTYFHMYAENNQHNFSFQVLAGIKYALRSDILIDAGLNYIWLGKMPLGTYSMDENDYTATRIAAPNAYLLGPRVNLIFYLN